MTNSIRILKCYRYANTWAFDDPTVGLVREPFVAGAPDILDALREHRGLTGNRLTILFSADPFPGYDAKLDWDAEEAGGNWYTVHIGRSPAMRGWLCPALFKYFEAAPKALYVRVSE